jgi:2-hydroxychromene-2-carboxylate isomerase
VIPAIYSAAWRDDKNIGDPEVLTAVLSGAGFDAKALIAAADTAEVKDCLRRNTEAAIAAGMCGVPTYRLSDAAGNDVIVWGQDRLNVVADCVHGWVDTPAAKL